MKKCSKCQIIKSENEFHKNNGRLYSSCKECKRNQRLKYRSENPEAVKSYNDSRKEYSKRYYQENKLAKIEYQKKYYQENIEIVTEKNKKYYEDNCDKIKIYAKQYQKENKERRNRNKKDRRKNDLMYNIKYTTSNLIRDSLRRNGFSKKSKSIEILGCSIDEFKNYLESKFESWMNWENRGKYNGEFRYGWDIDHIIPISSAKTEEDILKLNHYTNLQPLCSKINRDVKKNKIFFL